MKIELEEAKKRINVDTNRWSFDLYTAQSFTGEMDTWILVQKLEDPATDKKNLLIYIIPLDAPLASGG